MGTSNLRSSTTFDTLAELLRSVVLIQEVVRDFLEISKMAVEKRASHSQEVRVAGVINLNNAPGVLPSTHPPAVDLDDLLRPDNGERHEAAKLGVLLNRIFIILFNIIREIVNRDAVMFNVLHDELL